MFYNTATTGQTAGPIDISGSAVVNLIAPSSGTYQGIAFFQQHGLANGATISNSGTGNITGTYYFPDAPFAFTGNTATAVTAAFVASTITIGGSSSLTNDSTGKITGLAKTSVGVIPVTHSAQFTNNSRAASILVAARCVFPQARQTR